MIRNLFVLIFMASSLGVVANGVDIYNTSVNSCIENCDSDVYRELDKFQSELIAQGILSDTSNESLYALYDTIIAGGVKSMSCDYLLKNSVGEFYDCFLQFRNDTTRAFHQSELYKVCSLTDELLMGEYGIGEEVFAKQMKKVLNASDLNNSIYKYYTLSTFWFCVVNEMVTVPILLELPNNTGAKRKLITFHLNSDGDYYINANKVELGDMENIINNIIDGNPEQYRVLMIIDSKALYLDFKNGLDIFKKAGLEVEINSSVE